MKKITIITSAILLIAASSFAQGWTIDKAHSQLNWGIQHMSISEIDGSFGILTGKIASSKDDLSDAVIDLTADVNTISTGNDQRNNHLKSPDFFDAAKYGTITFHSTSFTNVGGKKYKATGDLTLHGITKSVTLDVVFNGTTVNPQSKKTVGGFKVTGIVKRSDFGIATGFPTAMLSDEVALNANTEFVKD
jgi:polyisoprenoid-binding protein YceI